MWEKMKMKREGGNVGRILEVYTGERKGFVIVCMRESEREWNA